jgi:hypothetical protein
MRIVDLSMTVDECESAPFAPEENYFKLRPIIKWEDKGFVSNVVQMTVRRKKKERITRKPTRFSTVPCGCIARSCLK